MRIIYVSTYKESNNIRLYINIYMHIFSCRRPDISFQCSGSGFYHYINIILLSDYEIIDISKFVALVLYHKCVKIVWRIITWVYKFKNKKKSGIFVLVFSVYSKWFSPLESNNSYILNGIHFIGRPLGESNSREIIYEIPFGNFSVIGAFESIDDS